MFNLDDIIPHFQIVNRKHYLGELLWNASSNELYKFKKEVKAHQKKSKFIQDLHYMPGMSMHNTIIAAINFALLKRSKLYPLYKLILPVRKRLVSWFSGIDIQEHPYCGALYVKRKNRETIFHITMTELALTLKRFWLSHWQWIIGIFISLGMLTLMILNYTYKKTP